MRKLLVLVVVLVTAAGISVAIATASSSRGGDLHLKKECSQIANSFCTITASNLALIKVGSRVVYLQAPGTTSLESDIVLVVARGNYALGHVTLDLATGQGVVSLSGGAGQFKSFHAKARVSPPGGVNGADWAWDGKYRFGDRD